MSWGEGGHQDAGMTPASTHTTTGHRKHNQKAVLKVDMSKCNEAGSSAMNDTQDAVVMRLPPPKIQHPLTTNKQRNCCSMRSLHGSHLHFAFIAESKFQTAKAEIRESKGRVRCGTRLI